MSRMHALTIPFFSGKVQETNSKLSIFLAISFVYLLSGCSLFHHLGKGPIEIEQSNNPQTWKEVYKMQATLWPLEMKVKEMEKKVNDIEKAANKIDKTVNETRDELATTKLSSMQANKNTEFLHGEIVKIKSASISKEKTSSDIFKPVEIKNTKEMLITETTKVARESLPALPAIHSIIINDIKYYQVSQTHDKVLIYVNAMNNPQLQTLIGERPRIVLDFLNTTNIAKEKYEIPTDGNFIKRIRVSSYREPLQKVRIVFDMIPNKKYSVERAFSKKGNVYSFDIRAN